MTWDPRQLAQQTGRTFVVTGANSGIGLETARDLLARGARVVLACRDVDKGERALHGIANGRPHATVLELDLADLESVATFAKTVAADVPDVHALVCNAGVMGGPFRTTAQGFELQLGTNHLGHAALVAALWPQLHAAAGRVVVVSSIAARGGALSSATTREDLVSPVPYSARQVYCNSKQANLLFAQELHRRAMSAGSPVTTVACHPGVPSTNLFPRLLADHGLGVLRPLARLVTAGVMPSAAAGALPTLRALDHSTPSGAFVGPDRLGQTRGRPELLEVYATGRDRAAAARLWALTEEILGEHLPV
jgi:NAD(P)-dependent dehydrogenase (short-subunit alcohol dehydrogenase family)